MTCPSCGAPRGDAAHDTNDMGDELCQDCCPSCRRDEVRAGIARSLIQRPLSWITDGDGTLWPPSTPHITHEYDGGCAVCRFGDTEEAMVVVLDVVTEAMAEVSADDWISDAESVIHQHCGSDGSSDEHNDWVHDLANALWRVVGR